MDFVTFIKTAVVGGVPLIFVIIGLVEWIKKLGVSGKWLLVCSMAVGLVFGSAYMVSQQRPPESADWWTLFVYILPIVVYGLAMGIIASGLYDAAKDMIEKTLLKISAKS